MWSIHPALDPSEAFKGMSAKNPADELVWMSSEIIKSSRDAKKRDSVLQAIADACKSFGIKNEQVDVTANTSSKERLSKLLDKD